ncbi:SoxR reducing system RseC family protein [Vreelandella nigrificans]|uniref:Fis family transcriptional regulator n=1 Tax=Vreelandella nigrificans TaxID=2042704 RepID=A0A2A4HSU0_9GAMM|nr:SoxR reducing system RseC family protein [Halomonas nigrificans]PCF97315.1 Fis family transcriptional regulator [Halomonas nigrificans]
MVDDTCTSLLRAGTVVGHDPSQGITIDVSVSVACEQCAKGRGCGMGLIARRQQQYVVLKPDCSPEHYQQRYPLGTSVTFTVSRADLTAIALLVYTMPLLFALILSGVAVWLGAVEWQSAAIFFGALMCGVIALKYGLRGRTEHFRPRLVS